MLAAIDLVSSVVAAQAASLAVFALWLSSTAAVGEASRPARSRSAMTRVWLIRPNNPSSRQRLKSSNVVLLGGRSFRINRYAMRECG